jgi:hypothetical protein
VGGKQPDQQEPPVRDIGELVIYLAIGLLVRLLAYGPVDWADAWVYVTVALWPAVLLWWSIPYLIAAAAIVLLACLCAGLRKRLRPTSSDVE